MSGTSISTTGNVVRRKRERQRITNNREIKVIQ